MNMFEINVGSPDIEPEGICKPAAICRQHACINSGANRPHAEKAGQRIGRRHSYEMKIGLASRLAV